MLGLLITSSPLYREYSLPSCGFCGTNCKTGMPFRKVLGRGQAKWQGQCAGTLGLRLGWNCWKCWAKLNFSIRLYSTCQEPTCFSYWGLHVFPSQFSENYLHTGPAAGSLRCVWANRKTFEHTQIHFPLRAFSSCSLLALVVGKAFSHH